MRKKYKANCVRPKRIEWIRGKKRKLSKEKVERLSSNIKNRTETGLAKSE